MEALAAANDRGRVRRTVTILGLQKVPCYN